MAGAILLALVIFLAFWLYDRYLTNRSNLIAERADLQKPIDPELSVLLAAEAVRIRHTKSAEDAIRQALDRLGQAQRSSNPPLTGDQLKWNSSISPNGKFEVTAQSYCTSGQPCSVFVNEVRTKQFLAVLSGHTGGVNSAVYSFDGKFIIYSFV